MKFAKLCALFATVLVLSGCLQTMQALSRKVSGGATLESMQAKPYLLAPTKTYQVPRETVIEAVEFAMQETGLKVLENVKVDSKEDFNAQRIIGELPASMQSWGQLVRVVVSTRTDKKAEVNIYYDSERIVSQNVTEDLITIQKKILLLIDDYITLAQS